MKPRAERLPPRFVERVWGRKDLSPWFPPQAALTGEVWFDADQLLIKFLFTSAPLSVQVHPDDEYAGRHEGVPGKTEMWYILDAAPDARIALGFAEPVTREQARRAAEDGTIESLLSWIPAEPGDTFFAPAGTVHALGAGLVLCEIQQNSDLTYRLYDYGRGRGLHLDRGFDVADLGTHPGKSTPDGAVLVSCRHFVTESHVHAEETTVPGGSVAVFLSGSGRIDGFDYASGEVWNLREDCTLHPASASRMLLCTVPQ